MFDENKLLNKITGNKCQPGWSYIIGRTGKTKCAKTQSGENWPPLLLCVFFKYVLSTD